MCLCEFRGGSKQYRGVAGDLCWGAQFLLSSPTCCLSSRLACLESFFSFVRGCGVVRNNIETSRGSFYMDGRRSKGGEALLLFVILAPSFWFIV